jgi:hypothetical protein
MVADFDDRVLAHIQVVIGAKLRRGESFYFTWRDDVGVGDGRSTIWVNPSIPIAYKYFGSRAPALNRDWIEALMATANSSAGLHIVPEPAAPPAATASGNSATPVTHKANGSQ